VTTQTSQLLRAWLESGSSFLPRLTLAQEGAVRRSLIRYAAEDAMRRPVISLLTMLVVAGVASAATAQTAATLPYDHVHLAAPDQAKAVEWYQKMFGGETSPEGKDRLFFGKTRFIWMKSDTAQPSANTAIDHIAFSVADRAPGFIEDPWGVKIEILNDPALRGFHHVHLRSTDPAASLAWYKQRFGGEATKFDGADALKYGDMLVLVDKSGVAPAPSAGHALDHVGWRVTDLDKTLADLKGIKVIQGRTDLQLATALIHFSFVEDPSGTKIELVQR
jgi:catechol 2,3-dioxygenase-like lactoylglutathione lyase family enzyme